MNSDWLLRLMTPHLFCFLASIIEGGHCSMCCSPVILLFCILGLVCFSLSLHLLVAGICCVPVNHSGFDDRNDFSIDPSPSERTRHTATPVYTSGWLSPFTPRRWLQYSILPLLPSFLCSATTCIRYAQIRRKGVVTL